MCHAQEPYWDGVPVAPKGVLLETEQQIAANARAIYLHSGLSNAMPPSNVSFMEAEERALIVEWYRNAMAMDR